MGLTTDPCPPGEHELAYDVRRDMRRCKHCGCPAQQLAANPRTAVKGDYRVVCRGTRGGDCCSIGPSDVIPAALPKLAIERYNEHQREAMRRDGEPHDAEVKEF